MNFLPAQHTDCVLAVLAEELGFLGVATILGLYFYLLHRGVVAARSSRDRLGTYLSLLVVAWFTGQIAVNVGMVTWHMIFEPDGGNQGPLKGVLMFLARKLRDNPDYPMTAQEQKEYEEVRAWWMANVVLKDGYLVTSHGGPILPGHTWDTLVYEPQTRLLIHGTGAYCSDAAVLHGRYHNLPLADVEKQIDPAYTSIWMFDPAQRRWIIHKRPQQGAMPELRGMGATMCYIPDLGKVIYYVAAQNVSPHSLQHRL